MNNEEENNSTEDSDFNNETIEQPLIEDQVNPLEQSSQSQDVAKKSVSTGKPRKNNSLLIIIVTILALTGCAVGAYFVFLPKTVVETMDAKQEAIDQAKEYSPGPDEACTMALVPAVHTKTGAKHTFPNGCLAPGWVADDSIVVSEKEKVMTTWSRFSAPTIGLDFSYPSEWGVASLKVMNSVPNELNPTFYNIKFSSRKKTFIWVTPEYSEKLHNTNFSSIKESLSSRPDTRHAFVNTDTIVGEIEPGINTGEPSVHIARLMDIPRVNAVDIVLYDFTLFRSSSLEDGYVSCYEDDYVTCYSDDELNTFQWLLESAEVQS